MSTHTEPYDPIRDLAEVLAGLQVPRSIQGGYVLGKALEPYDRLRKGLSLFGYPDAAEHERRLRQILAPITENLPEVNVRGPAASDRLPPQVAPAVPVRGPAGADTRLRPAQLPGLDGTAGQAAGRECYAAGCGEIVAVEVLTTQTML